MNRRPPLNFGATDETPSGAGDPFSDPFAAPGAGEPADAGRDGWVYAPDPTPPAAQSQPVTHAQPVAPSGPAAAPPVEAATDLQVEDAAFEAAFAPRPAWPVYLGAFAVSVLWAIGPIAFAVGYRKHVSPLQDDLFAMTVFALLAIGPAILVFVAAYLIRQGQRLSAETRRAKAIAERMLAPSLIAAARAGEVAQGVRDEIQRAAQAADQARETMLALRQALSVESEQLIQTTRASMTAAGELAGQLGRERSEMRDLAQTLDAQAMKVADTITRQARMVSEASEVADAQLREAEAALSARAADLAAAANEAGDTARTAGEDLVRHIARLEAAGVGVADQVRAVEGGLSEQRTALVNLSQALRADHEGFAAEADSYAAKLGDFIKETRISAFEVSDRATKGGEALKQLVAEAADRMRQLTDAAAAEREAFGQSTVTGLRDLSSAAQAERDAFGRSAAESLDAIYAAAGEHRAQLESETRAAISALERAANETREASARNALTAREQVDQLSEAAFAAGQRANQVFEARLEEARALVEQSSKMVEQAGAATARKLDEGAAAARATLTELQSMMTELETRARALPAAARDQAEQIQAMVAKGMEELTAHARRTAEEAQAIDAAFQDRVRRNFEMLSEAVRLMGASTPASAALGPMAAAASEPTPAAAGPAAPPAAPFFTPAPRPNFSAGFTRPVLRPAEAAEPPPAIAPAPAPEPAAAAPEPPRAPEPAPPPAPEPAKAAAAPPPPAPQPPASQPAAPQPATAEADGSEPTGSALAERLGLRPRLKLTPTATDAEFSAIFEAAGGAGRAETGAREGEEGEEGEPESGEPWTWKDLLASIGGGVDGEASALEQRLAGELGKMGVSPEALLPKPRVEAIAAALQTGDRDGSRQVVKRLAASAVRRIVRRLFTDAAMKSDAVDFIRRYRTLLDDAAVRDPAGFLMADLLSGEGGRIYLLLDAAGGDEV